MEPGAEASVAVETELLRGQCSAALGCVCEGRLTCMGCRITDIVLKEFGISGVRTIVMAVDCRPHGPPPKDEQ